MSADLLTRFIQAYPAQPATAYWRAIEILALSKAGLPEGRGLDLGCGDGKLTDILISLVGERRFVGIDPDPLETAAAARFPFYEAVHTAHGDAIPEADASFDFVISNSVLEHIPDLDPVIEEVGRVLRPGGRFYFTVPCPTFHANLAGSVIPFAKREDYLGRLDRRLAHYSYLDPNGWKALCAAHGLVVESCRGYLAGPETRRWETLSRMTGGLLYSLGGGALRPIEIQRRLGARALQNNAELPLSIATALARLVSAGVPGQPTRDPWRSLETASCLLVEGGKPG